MQVKELLEILNELAPMAMAEDYDNVGLIVGSERNKVTSVLLGLDLTEELLEEAREIGADTIITHHPFIFNSIKKIDIDDYTGKILNSLIKNDISYIAMHTNMDKCAGGLNDYLAELIGLEKVQVMEDETNGYHIMVYAPKADAENITQAMIASGGGNIGEYFGCSFEHEGIGQFIPTDKATPHIGVAFQKEKADEIKIEMYCDGYRVNRVIKAMLEAHPYEEPVYYIVPGKVKGEYGFGRYGEINKEMTLKELCQRLKEVLSLPVIAYVGDGERLIRRVGLCTGAGGSMYNMAVKMGLDAFITGDIKHNVSVEASGMGTALIDGGHYGTESIFKNIMARHLQNAFDELQCSVNINFSKAEKSPWNYV